MAVKAKQILKKKGICVGSTKMLFFVPVQWVQAYCSENRKANISHATIPASVMNTIFYRYKMQKEDHYLALLKKGLDAEEPVYSGTPVIIPFDSESYSEIQNLKLLILSNALVPLVEEIVLVNFFLGVPYDQMAFLISFT
jgi:hypothetical protein